MDADELAGLLAAGDYYGLMLRVNAAFAARYHPDARRATVVIELADRTMISVPVIPCPASSSPPRPLVVPAAPRP